MICENILSIIGNTPLVRINALGINNLFVKLEQFNPGGSIKDRPAMNMLKEAEKKGYISPGDTIIEPTSGNTGVGLAMVSAVKGYKAIFTMPETMTIERRKILQAYGAEIILTNGVKGMQGAVEKAEELSKKYNYFMLQQFKNFDNVSAHKTTAEEIWNDTEGGIDILVCAIGTGGTVSGTGRFLKTKNPNLIIIGIEPENSAVISRKSSGFHKIQGIGAGFIPEILEKNLLDEIILVSDKQAFEYTNILAKKEGILAGISSGAVLYAMDYISKKQKYIGKKIVGILPDTGERYLSYNVF
jgi:cysteine synthase A